MDGTDTKPRALDGRAAALMVLLCALWGLQQSVVKLAVAGGVPPLLQAGTRSAVAAVLVLGWTAWRDGRGGVAGLFRPDATLRPGLLLAATFTVEFAIAYPGFTRTTAAHGVLFFYTAPFFTALGAHLLLPGERLRPRQAAGLAVAFAGVALAFAGGLRGGTWAGDAMCLAAAALWGATNLQVKGSPALQRARPGRVLLYQLGVSAPVLLALSAASGEWAALPWPGAATWACLAYQGVVVSFASYLAWFALMRRFAVTLLSGFTFLTPVLGIVAAGLLLGERVGPATLAGVVGVAVGLVLLNGNARRGRAIPS